MNKIISPCDSCAMCDKCPKPCQEWKDWFTKYWSETRAMFQSELDKKKSISVDDQTELLKYELKTLVINLERAKHRPGVTDDEIGNLERKIKLKRELLDYIGVSE